MAESRFSMVTESARAANKLLQGGRVVCIPQRGRNWIVNKFPGSAAKLE